MTSARQTDISKRLQNIEQLNTVIAAIRGIAASRVQQGRAALDGVEVYRRMIDDAIATALALLGKDGAESRNSRHERGGLVLFCTEQGFVGGHNERIFEIAGQDFAGDQVFIVGSRGLVSAEERGLHPVWSIPAPTHAGGIGGTALHITDVLFAHIESAHLTRIDMVAPGVVGGQLTTIERRSLIPVDFSRFSRTRSRMTMPPLTTLPPAVLLERLVAEYVYAELFAATARTFLAENEIRMIGMTSAKVNVEKLLDDLTLQSHRIRQDDTTAEVIELSAGRLGARL